MPPGFLLMRRHAGPYANRNTQLPPESVTDYKWHNNDTRFSRVYRTWSTHLRGRVLQRCWPRAIAEVRGVDAVLLWMVRFLEKASYCGGIRRANAIRGGFIHRAHSFPPSLPAIFCCFHTFSSPRILMGFRYITKRHCTGNPRSPRSQYSSTTLLQSHVCVLDRAQPYRFYFLAQLVWQLLIECPPFCPSAHAFIFIARTVIAVVLPPTRRCAQPRGHKPGSNSSGVGGHFTKNVPKTPTGSTTGNTETFFPNDFDEVVYLLQCPPLMSMFFSSRSNISQPPQSNEPPILDGGLVLLMGS